jgi:hypothetical protein
MPGNTSTLAYLFRTDYSDAGVMDAVTRDRPLSRMIGKSKGKPAGSSFIYTIKYANAGSVGATFAAVQAAPANSKGVQVSVTPQTKYGLIQMDGPSILRATSRGAFVDLVRDQTDSVLEEMADHHSFDLFRNGNGIRGRRASASTNIITLATAIDARNFRVGMPVGASANADGSSARTGNTTVDSVDISAGTITLTSAAAITSFADNDYIFVVSENTGVNMDGLDSLLPLTAPSPAESFRGHDRTKDVQRLAGARLSSTSAPIHENIGVLGTSISGIGGKSDMCFVSPEAFYKVTRQLSAKVEYDGDANSVTYGFSFASVASPAGILKLVADADCKPDRFWVGKMKELEVLYLGPEWVHVIRDGNSGDPELRQYNADGLEVRVRSVGQTALYAPRDWGVGAI